MDKKLKVKWIAALRSGKFKQVQCELKGREDGVVGYCCLGVLRQIMHKGSTAMHKDEEVLCDKHEKEAGLTYKIQTHLASMNDEGKTFGQIAKYIEKRL